jgi:hypothetical protein
MCLLLRNRLLDSAEVFPARGVRAMARVVAFDVRGFRFCFRGVVGCLRMLEQLGGGVSHCVERAVARDGPGDVGGGVSGSWLRFWGLVL